MKGPNLRIYVNDCLNLFGFEFPAGFYDFVEFIRSAFVCLLVEFSVKINGAVLKTKKGYMVEFLWPSISKQLLNKMLLQAIIKSHTSTQLVTLRS